MGKSIKRKALNIKAEPRRKRLTSHGEGRRFNPYHSNHSTPLENAENGSLNEEFRGLPFHTLPYRSLLRITLHYRKRGYCGDNGKRPRKRGAA